MGQPCDVDKMLSDFLAELQALSDSLQASGEKSAPEPGTEQSDDMPREVLPAAAQHAAATQPPPLTTGGSATDPFLPARNINVLPMDNARPPRKAQRLDDRSRSPARALKKWRLTLLGAGVSFVLICLLGVLYRLGPFGSTARWNQLTPPAPSPGASMPDPSSPGPAVPIATRPTPPSSTGSQPPTAPAAPPRPTTIGVSYRTITARLDRFFAMKKVGPVEGQERYMGQTDDKMATLEIIGNKDDVSEACFTTGLPSADPGAAERNGMFAFVFINNIEPEWADGPNWIADNLLNMSNSETESVEIIRGKRRIWLRWMKGIGMMSISVRHEGQKDPVTGHAPPK